MPVNVFGHSGDLGDIIASLPTARAMGGGRYVIFNRENGHRESMQGARYEAIKPLLLAQPYICGVEWSDAPPGGITHDFSTFRHDWKQGENLLDWQARHLGVTASPDPWLTAIRSPVALGRPVFARSLRYRNPAFPWAQIRQKYVNGVFVGTRDEYRAFQISTGSPLEYAETPDLLSLAEVINGASIFIGNQSCPFWIAAGLGVPLIQEVCAACPNSIVKRPNARYFLNPPFTI